MNPDHRTTANTLVDFTLANRTGPDTDHLRQLLADGSPIVVVPVPTDLHPVVAEQFAALMVGDTVVCVVERTALTDPDPRGL